MNATKFCAAIVSTLIFTVVTSRPAFADHDHGEGSGWSTSRADGHAPIGVMADHVHAEGEVMFSYRYMNMRMKGNRDGTNRVSTSDLFNPAQGWNVVPTRMDMEVHMVGLMYAVSDEVTLMAMVPFVRSEMEHRAMNNTVGFTTRSSGIGDARLSGLIPLVDTDHHRLHVNAGLSFPTGAIDERDDTPMGPDTKLPYPMQLGSGTYDFLPGVTYSGQTDDWSWGTQLSGTMRIADNSDHYALGDRASVSGWGALRLGQVTSVSLRFDGQWWDDIDGHDPELPPATAMVVPTARPDLRAGRCVDALVGVNFFGVGGLGGHRLAFEFGKPVYQDLDGPQLETDWLFTIGWQYAR